MDVGDPNVRALAIPVEYSIIPLRDMADVINHPMHGAVGALVIQPPGSEWFARRFDAVATVRYPGPDGKPRQFRELVLVAQDDVPFFSDDHRFRCEIGRLQLRRGAAEPRGAVMTQRTPGGKAFNMRSEPLWARFGIGPHRRGSHGRPQ